jgi:hypothetical protein
MSTAPTPPRPPKNEINIVGHSNLFYFWPVWAVGFILGVLTWFDGSKAFVIPPGYDYLPTAKASNSTGKSFDGRDMIVLPDGHHPATTKEDLHTLHTSRSSTYGVIFAIVLLLVITLTNVPLRGMWSFAVIGGIVIFSLLMSLFNLWDTIFYYMSGLDIRLNMGAYFFISTILLAIWVATVFFFDKQVYMIFTPGQLKVCLEIGGGETSYDMVGLVIQKERSDLFRHWVLGLGSGDLIVRTSGSTTHEFHLNNVLFITHKLQEIESMQRDRPMVKG